MDSIMTWDKNTTPAAATRVTRESRRSDVAWLFAKPADAQTQALRWQSVVQPDRRHAPPVRSERMPIVETIPSRQSGSMPDGAPCPGAHGSQSLRLPAQPSCFEPTSAHPACSLVLDDADGNGIAAASWQLLRASSSAASRRIAALESLHVVPPWQRRGVGSELLELVCDWAETRGAEALTLRCEREMEAFFVTRGFQPLRDAFDGTPHSKLLWRHLT